MEVENERRINATQIAIDIAVLKEKMKTIEVDIGDIKQDVKEIKSMVNAKIEQAIGGVQKEINTQAVTIEDLKKFKNRLTWTIAIIVFLINSPSIIELIIKLAGK